MTYFRQEKTKQSDKNKTQKRILKSNQIRGCYCFILTISGKAGQTKHTNENDKKESKPRLLLLEGKSEQKQAENKELQNIAPQKIHPAKVSTRKYL